jgi:hypothetical protein
LNDLPDHMLRSIGIWPFRDPVHHRIWREGTVTEAAWLKKDGCLIHPASLFAKYWAALLGNRRP